MNGVSELSIVKQVFEELRYSIANATQEVITEYTDYGNGRVEVKYKTVVSTEILLKELDKVIEKYEFAINTRNNDVVSVPELS